MTELEVKRKLDEAIKALEEYQKNLESKKGLWFDDIKAFARYYNLQDRLAFPLDRTTAECMENHLIHLPSGGTIEAVGTMDI